MENFVFCVVTFCVTRDAIFIEDAIKKIVEKWIY